MTHVVHPFAHRLGGIRKWKSNWTFSKNDYKEFLKIDYFVRSFLEKELSKSHISSIEFFRDFDKKYTIIIKTAKAGMIVGRDGGGIIKITKKIKNIFKKHKLSIPKNLKIDIQDVRNSDADAEIVAAIVRDGMERKMPFRRVMKSAVEKSMINKEVKGIKISMSGGLGGSAMARKEFIKKGRIPLSTFRADVDYATQRANLPLGVVGIKVWIYRGDVFDKKS